jgi:putative transposase
MSRKRFTPEQIIVKLREAEVGLAQGQTVGQVCRTLGIAEQTFSLAPGVWWFKGRTG